MFGGWLTGSSKRGGSLDAGGSLNVLRSGCLKRKVARAALAAALLGVCASLGSAATITWVGGVSGNRNDWFTAANWNPAVVPSATTNADVSIPAGRTYYPIVSANAVVNGSLSIASSGTLSISAGQTVTVSNNLAFTAGGGGGVNALQLSGDLNLYGTITSTTPNAYCNGSQTGWVNMLGGGDQTISSAMGVLPAIKVNKSSGHLQVVGDLNCVAFYVSPGNSVEFDSDTSTLSFGGASGGSYSRGLLNYGAISNAPALVFGWYAFYCQLRSGGVTFPSLTVTNQGHPSYYVQLLDDARIAGDVSVRVSGSLDLSTHTLTIGGSYYQDTNINTALIWKSGAAMVFTSSIPAVISSGGTTHEKSFPNLTINKPNAWVTITNTSLLVEGVTNLNMVAGELRSSSASAELWLGALLWAYPFAVADVGLKTSDTITTNSFTIPAGPPLSGGSLHNIAPYARIRTTPYGSLVWRTVDADNPTKLGTASQLETAMYSFRHYEYRFDTPQPVSSIKYCQRLPFFALSLDTTGNGHYDTLLGIQNEGTNALLSNWVGRQYFETHPSPAGDVYGVRLDILALQDGTANHYDIPGIYDLQILSPSSALVTTNSLDANVALAEAGATVVVTNPTPAQRFTQGFILEPWMFGSTTLWATNSNPNPSIWKTFPPLTNLVNQLISYHANLGWIFPPVSFGTDRSGVGALYATDDLWPSQVTKWFTPSNHLQAISKVMQTNGLSVFVEDRAPYFKAASNPNYNIGPIVSQLYRDTFSTFVGEQTAAGIDGVGTCLDEEVAWPGDTTFTSTVNSNAFYARFGIAPPTAAGDTEAYRKWMLFSYEQVGALHAQAAQAAKATNSQVRTGASVESIYEAFGNGRFTHCFAAYDISGHMGGMDMFGTDPYHTQDDDDLSHYKSAAYTKRMIAATTNRQSVVVLNCPWADNPTTYPGFYWHFPPVSMSGPVISSMMQGGQAFSYWRWNYIFYGGYDQYVRQAYAMLDTLASWGAKSADVPQSIAVLKSRASEDWWQLKATYNPTSYSYPSQFRGYVYEKWLLEFLFMNAYPFEMYYQDQVQDYTNRLSQYKLVLLPFPYSMSQPTYNAIAAAASAGTKFIAFDRRGEVNEYGTAYGIPLLSNLVAQGSVMLVTNDVTVMGSDADFLASMRAQVDSLLGSRKPLYLNRYGSDVEAGCLEKSDQEKFVSLINWSHHSVTVDVGVTMSSATNYNVFCCDLNVAYQTNITSQVTIGGSSVVTAAGLQKFRVSMAPDEIKVFYVMPTTSSVPQQALIIVPVSDRTLVAGQTLVITNSVVTPPVPAYPLTWETVAVPGGATLDPASGVLNWRPTQAQAPSTNTISFKVTDSGAPAMVGTQSFVAAVTAAATPAISGVSASNDVFAMQVSGSVGPDYTVLDSTNLVQWTPLLTNTPAALPAWLSDPSPMTNDRRFYRVVIGP
jgi:hypothetical protein